MDRWLEPALDYIPRWLEFQMRITEQPGCAYAVARNGRVLLEGAFGVADMKTGAALTPRHRFRVASHSKSFTAAGVTVLSSGSSTFAVALGTVSLNTTPSQLVSSSGCLSRSSVGSRISSISPDTADASRGGTGKMRPTA